MDGYFAMSPTQMQTMILDSHEITIRMLADKGIAYGQLRSALTPQRDKHELALLFDSQATGNRIWYGLPVYERILAALPKQGFNCAFQIGDLIIKNQDYGFELLAREVILHRSVREFTYTNEIFAVYINNLTPTLAASLREQLESWDAYIGYIDCTYSSSGKDWMSVTLPSSYIKAGSVFIGEHEDDADLDQDQNLLGWPFEEAGFTLRSIPSTYFQLFLSYKIERRVAPGDTDTKYSLNVLSDKQADLSDFEIIIEEAKHEYVTSHEGGLRAAGLSEVTREQLERQIRQRLARSYVYAMESKAHPAGITNKFCVMLEFEDINDCPFRLLGAFEYQVDNKILRLITLY
jgi:hypothetical protein